MATLGFKPYSNKMFASHLSRRYYNFFVGVLVILVFGFFLLYLLQLILVPHKATNDDALSLLNNEEQWNHLILNDEVSKTPTNKGCNFFNCFNVYRCGRSLHQELSIYVYPPIKYLNKYDTDAIPMSEEFAQIMETIINSKYFTAEIDEACIFIPSIDTLNENNLRIDYVEKALASLPHWNEGENHLLFNMLPGISPKFGTSLGAARGSAMLAGGSFSSQDYRRGFDISIPVYNPLYQNVTHVPKPFNDRKWLVVSSQVNIHRSFQEDLQTQLVNNEDSLLLLKTCSNRKDLTSRCSQSLKFNYPHILEDSKLCLVIRGGRLGQTALYDAMRAGCIPIIVADTYVLPFSEIVDWQLISIQIYEEQFLDMMNIVSQKYSSGRLREMHEQVKYIFDRYFKSMREITLTTLQILEKRIAPGRAILKADWNRRPRPSSVHNPLFLPITANEEDGCTAVILTYDRLASLYQVIKNVAQVSSVVKILVIWNNQRKRPPVVSRWPIVQVPVKVIETDANQLSNRFIPYDQIETECILAIDDDINMMTKDELQFGYEVWREFPDRIVGFPSRNVIWKNQTLNWEYDSEWTNEVSMVLTGIAFYHKYWSHVYTHEMPGDIRSWVDENMNCEDIAMNFLVANLTGKAPIKVTPRKKFKCTECSAVDISANQAHLVERSQCVQYFTKIFGTMPLKTVEFRADPVLFKDKISNRLKNYYDIGSL